jgi:AraC family transcriptional regulator, regulatory protein of adaptative response / methylated-DNA-[protein]-cysteine methyltransferase
VSRESGLGTRESSDVRLPSSGFGLFSALIPTPLGEMLGIAGPSGLALLEFADRPMLPTQLARIGKLFGGAVESGAHPVLDHAERELAEYFRGERWEFSVPLAFDGTVFQRKVWNALLQIPAGQTRSYESIATDIGVPGGSRAVGRANGDNRIAIIVPCHRVIRADGNLCGYGGGLWRKRRLLELEGKREQLGLELMV